MTTSVVAATTGHHEKILTRNEKMKKILMETDSIVVDGLELSYEELKNVLTENVVLKRQLNFVRTTFNEVGVSNE